MPYFKIPFTGYTVVEADSPEEATEAYEDEDFLLEEKDREAPELIDEDEYERLLHDWN